MDIFNAPLASTNINILLSYTDKNKTKYENHITWNLFKLEYSIF
jgi:hypothetical protein